MSSSKAVKAKADPVVVSNSETQKATMAYFRSTCHSLEDICRLLYMTGQMKDFFEGGMLPSPRTA